MPRKRASLKANKLLDVRVRGSSVRPTGSACTRGPTTNPSSTLPRPVGSLSYEAVSKHAVHVIRSEHGHVQAHGTSLEMHIEKEGGLGSARDDAMFERCKLPRLNFTRRNNQQWGKKKETFRRDGFSAKLFSNSHSCRQLCTPGPLLRRFCPPVRRGEFLALPPGARFAKIETPANRNEGRVSHRVLHYLTLTAPLRVPSRPNKSFRCRRGRVKCRIGPWQCHFSSKFSAEHRAHTTSITKEHLDLKKSLR